MSRAIPRLDELEEIARVATLEALAGYPVSDEMRARLVLGVRFDGDTRVFELYLPGERPEDALIIAEAVVHPFTRAVSVRVFKPPTRDRG